MEKIKVSILVPIYNTSGYIERCAHSLFGQSYDNIEYIFVNDCTPDDSIVKLEAVLERYPDRKRQVKLISHQENQGLAISRNTAVLSATGDYLFHVDSDDFVPKDAVQQLTSAALRCDTDIVYGICEGFDGKRKIYFPQKKTNNVGDYLRNVLTRRCMVNIWGKLIKRRLYSSELFLNKEDSFGEDYLTLPKLIARSNSVLFLNDTVYYYTIDRVGSYSNCFDRTKMSRIKQCEEQLFEWFENHSGSFSFDYEQAFKLGAFYNKAGIIEHANYADYAFIEKLYPQKAPLSLLWKMPIKHLAILLFYDFRLWKIIKLIVQFKGKQE